MDKGTFSERLKEILGSGADDVTTIMLHMATQGPAVVTVAIKTEKHGVIRQHRYVPVEKLTPRKLLSAAEDAHGTLTTCIAVIAGGTPTFDEQSDVG